MIREYDSIRIPFKNWPIVGEGKREMDSRYIFIIGAQKSGTTFLASCLDMLNEVCVSNPKEPQFFTTNFDKGFDYYESLFLEKAALYRVDASTTYSFLRPIRDLDRVDAPGLDVPVPDRIKAFAPNAKIVYLLRDPVDRMVSALGHHARRTGSSATEISLRAEIEHDPMLRLASGYSDQLARYREAFDERDILVVDFKRLMSAPVTVVNEVAAFAGITEHFDAEMLVFAEKHQGYSLSWGMRHLRNLLVRLRLVSMMRAITPKGLRKRFKKPIQKPVVTDRSEAEGLFVQEYALLDGLAAEEAQGE